MTFQIDNKKTAEHLLHLIVNRNGDTPNFSLLLGAGASVTSDVQTAQDLIDDWRRMLFQRSRSDKEYLEWLNSQPWFQHDDEYSILFGSIYDQPSQRRVRVEECVKGAHPSWGYVYLTSLLSHRFFDVVFTTNFDDLINEACYLYSDGVRPIVAAHDSAIQGIRVTSNRPKIIKLHGDFLYDDIKNTLAELETLEANTKRKLHQFAQEYGLVVLGYSGRDRSVMDTLELLLRDDENYKQGVYWCHRSDAPVSARLASLLRRDRVYLVDIVGFDEFMADLHREGKLELPMAIASPFEMALDRARLFVDVKESLNRHPVIREDIVAVMGNIIHQRPKLPLAIEAEILSKRGELDEAVAQWRKAYKEDPRAGYIASAFAEALIEAGSYDELDEIVNDAPIPPWHKTYLLLRAGRNEDVVDVATKTLARAPHDAGRANVGRDLVIINRAIALKRLGRNDEMMADLGLLEEEGYTGEARIRAGVAALRKEKEEMLAALKEAVPGSISREQLTVFPVFEDYQDDAEFIQFIDELAPSVSRAGE